MYSDEKIIALLQQILDEVRLLRQEVRPRGGFAVPPTGGDAPSGAGTGAAVAGLDATTVRLPNAVSPADSTERPRTGGIPPAVHGGQLAEQALLECGVKVKVLKTFPDGQDTVDSLSVFLGSRFSSLSAVLARIKSKVAEGGDISLSLRNESQEAVSNICQFCTRLHAMAYLRRYRYLKSPHYQAYLTVSPEPFAQVFFNGAWLERYALYVLADVCARTCGGDLDYLANPSVYLPNGDDFELDIFAVSRGRPVWVEAKSGDYQIHVAKYAKLARQLGLQGRFVLLASGCPAADCSALAATHGIRVANCETLAATLEEMLDGGADVCGCPDATRED